MEGLLVIGLAVALVVVAGLMAGIFMLMRAGKK
jgi:hypothetical protein